MTADVQRELAEALYPEITFPTVGTRWDRANHAAAALLPAVQALIADAEKRAAAAALEQAADKWQRGAWADTPRHADQVADRIGAAQYVTEWLRARAAALDPSGAAEGAGR